MSINRRFLLQRRPNGDPVAEDFALISEATPELGEGQFLIRNHYASLDPAMRGWMDDADSYMPPIPLGAAVRASTIGVVEASRAEGFAPGQWVMGLNAIEEYSVGAAGGFTQPIDAGVEVQVHQPGVEDDPADVFEDNVHAVRRGFGDGGGQRGLVLAAIIDRRIEAVAAR